MNPQRTVIRPYNQATVNRIEFWLQKCAKEGWILIQHNGWKFVFETHRESQREYFVLPSFDNSKGFHSMYHIVKRKYGKSRSKSKLNKTNSGIFEIDPTKIDAEFQAHKAIRNRFCIKHYGWMLGIVSVFMLTFVTLVTLKNINYFFLAILLWLVPFFYQAASLFIICKDSKKHQKRIK